MRDNSEPGNLPFINSDKLASLNFSSGLTSIIFSKDNDNTGYILPKNYFLESIFSPYCLKILRATDRLCTSSGPSYIRAARSCEYHAASGV